MQAAVKVGLFTLLGLVVLFFLILRSEDIELFGPKGTTLEATFPSVAGLDDKAPVRIAGVRVGRVDGIGLDGQQAVVRIKLEQPVALPQGTQATIRNTGLLGDKYVELVLGPENAPPLPDGVRLRGTTPPGFDEAMAKLNQVADAIQGVTGQLGGGPNGEQRIAVILDNVAVLSADLRELVAANREAIGGTVRNFEAMSATLARELPRLADQLQQVLGQVDAVIAENRGDLRGSLQNVEQLTTKLQTSADNLNQITGRLARGEGSIGKLLTDDEAHDELVATLDSVQSGVATLSQSFGKITRMRLDLGLEGAYLEGPQESRTAFSLQLDPQNEARDRFYRVELVDDPRGRTRTKTETTTVIRDDGSRETTTTERTTTEDKLLLSAQFGFRLGAAQARLGLIESTGGGAIDYGFFEDRLRLSLEAFDFGRENDLDPHLRLLGRYQLHPNLYVVGGYDDPLVSERESLFLGAGITWRDDDLKYLLGSVPLGGL